MKKSLKYGKVILTVICSFTMITLVESSYIRQRLDDADRMTEYRTYETISDKTNSREFIPTEKKAVKPTQNSTEMGTTKDSQKATQKPIQKSTQKSTQQVTEKTTVKATQKSTPKSKTTVETITQVPTEPPTESHATEPLLSEYENSTDGFVIVTDPPTEWSQELQNNYDEQYERGYLIAIDNPDYGYSTGQVTLCESDKKLACQIVMGEAGGESFEDCCVVAQCLKDSMVFLGYNSIADVQKECRYDGFREEYSQTAQAAVEYIFDQNRSAIAHRVLFFYAADLCQSEWHETQNHLLTRRYARYFDMW